MQQKIPLMHFSLFPIVNNHLLGGLSVCVYLQYVELHCSPHWFLFMFCLFENHVLSEKGFIYEQNMNKSA